MTEFPQNNYHVYIKDLLKETASPTIILSLSTKQGFQTLIKAVCRNGTSQRRQCKPFVQELFDPACNDITVIKKSAREKRELRKMIFFWCSALSSGPDQSRVTKVEVTV